ncbi:hypothetical protein GCM10010416_19630 [Streptomyces caniferus]
MAEVGRLQGVEGEQGAERGARGVVVLQGIAQDGRIRRLDADLPVHEVVVTGVERPVVVWLDRRIPVPHRRIIAHACGRRR